MMTGSDTGPNYRPPAIFRSWGFPSPSASGNLTEAPPRRSRTAGREVRGVLALGGGGRQRPARSGARAHRHWRRAGDSVPAWGDARDLELTVGLHSRDGHAD